MRNLFRKPETKRIIEADEACLSIVKDKIGGTAVVCACVFHLRDPRLKHAVCMLSFHLAVLSNETDRAIMKSCKGPRKYCMEKGTLQLAFNPLFIMRMCKQTICAEYHIAINHKF